MKKLLLLGAQRLPLASSPAELSTSLHPPPPPPTANTHTDTQKHTDLTKTPRYTALNWKRAFEREDIWWSVSPRTTYLAAAFHLCSNTIVLQQTSVVSSSSGLAADTKLINMTDLSRPKECSRNTLFS